MSKAFVVWDGLAEYKEELRQLPAACLGEGRHAVEGGVNGAYVAISTVYGAHRVTGTLQKRLKITPLKVSGQYSTGLVLTSGSPIAVLFDRGSQARHYVTVNGVDHVTGRMPPNPIFTSSVAKAKREIVAKLKEIVLRRGAVSVTET